MVRVRPLVRTTARPLVRSLADLPRAVELAAWYPTDVLAGSLADNSLIIRDSVTPANNYTGPLIIPATGDPAKGTFTRASTAYRRNAAGLLESVAANKPRISYEPYGPVLLSEGARTNLHMFSTDVSSAAWSKNGLGVGAVPTITPNFAVSPTGAVDATRVQCSLNGGTAGTDHSTVSQAPTSTITTVHAQGMWVKANGASEVGKTILFRGCAGAGYLLVTLTDSWQRVQTIETSSVATATFSFGLRGSFAVSDTVDFLVWNIQSEIGPWLSSDIVSGAVATTRATETFYILNTQFNLTQSVGAVYVRAEYDGGSALSPSNRCPIALSDGTTAERHILYNSSGLISSYTADGGVLQEILVSAVTTADGVVVKKALAYAVNDFAFSVNGATPLTDTLGTLPTTDRLEVGTNGTAVLHGGVSEFAFFGARLSNAQLQALTT